MAFPPKPPPFTADPDGKPGIPDHLVENARREIELARSEAELNKRVQRVAHRMRGRPATIGSPSVRYPIAAGSRLRP